MFTRSFDLVWSSILACAAVAVAFSPGVPTAIRALVGLPLVLVLPGYALTAAVTPRLGRWGADKVVFTLGTSIAVAVLGGLVLNFTPWGLERRSWSVLLAAFTIVAATGAALRRAGAAETPSGPRGRVQRHSAAASRAGSPIAMAAVGISRRGAIQADQQTRFTQMWMLPTNGKKDLRIGIINREGSTQHYRIVLRDGRRQLATFPAIDLAAGAKWISAVHVPSDLPPRARIQADLYRAARPRVIYRHVTFWTP